MGWVVISNGFGNQIHCFSSGNRSKTNRKACLALLGGLQQHRDAARGHFMVQPYSAGCRQFLPHHTPAAPHQQEGQFLPHHTPPHPTGGEGGSMTIPPPPSPPRGP